MNLKIRDRPQISECQAPIVDKCGEVVSIYNAELDEYLTWSYMTKKEQEKLIRYRELLMCPDIKNITVQQEEELDFLMDWTIENDICCADIPEGK